MLNSRGEIACALYACHAMWLRHCATASLVTAVGYEDFLEHAEVPGWKN
jgi:hypothetical protein